MDYTKAFTQLSTQLKRLNCSFDEHQQNQKMLLGMAQLIERQQKEIEDLKNPESQSETPNEEVKS